MLSVHFSQKISGCVGCNFDDDVLSLMNFVHHVIDGKAKEMCLMEVVGGIVFKDLTDNEGLCSFDEVGQVVRNAIIWGKDVFSM